MFSGKPSYSYCYGGFTALPRAQLWSHRSLLGGYYLLLNPIIVYYDGSYPMLNYAITPFVRQIAVSCSTGRESLLTAITTMVLLRVPRREASGYDVTLSVGQIWQNVGNGLLTVI